MDHNRRLCLLFAVLFIAMLALPYPLWVLTRDGLDTENRENRELAAFPTLGTVGYRDTPAAFEDWLADHAPFRNQWMTLNAGVNWRLFGTIESEVVLRGEEDWMFYRNSADSASLDDYQGINHYTGEQLAQIAANLNALQAGLAQKGIELAVIIAPNKELVYRRYMPQSIPMVNPESRVDALAAYLAGATTVPLVWPEAELRALSETQPVYYKYDTHWNEAGAAVASAMLLQALGQPAPRVDVLAFEPCDTPPLRDLTNLSATWKLAGPDEAWRVKDWAAGTKVELMETDERGYYHRYSSNAENRQKLLMFRDSFGEAMQLPLAAYYGESSFVHINAWDENTLAEEQPDLLVLEITQRYCDRLLDYLPRMVAWAGC